MTLRSLLPAPIAVVETTDVDRVVRLHEGEREFVARAVEARRNEFALGRLLAHQAVTMLGGPAAPITVGDHREPIWPSEMVGSITHCDGYAAAAVAHTDDARSVGIDAEPKLPLPNDVVKLVVSADEQSSVSTLGEFGDRVVFSAKESIYKAWFPLTGRWLGFSDCHVSLSTVDASSGTFIGTVDPAVLHTEADVAQFHGRFLLSSNHIMTAVLVPPAG